MAESRARDFDGRAYVEKGDRAAGETGSADIAEVRGGVDSESRRATSGAGTSRTSIRVSGRLGGRLREGAVALLARRVGAGAESQRSRRTAREQARTRLPELILDPLRAGCWYLRSRSFALPPV